MIYMADVRVDLTFAADTSKARMQIKELANTLQNLTKTSAGKSDILNLTPSLQKANQAAATLQATLQSAMNPKTGKLDLTRFNESLKQSGMTLAQYKMHLEEMGPQGTKAFNQLATAIQNAEVPTKRVNTRMQEFATTLKNTAKWQISSSILHGFMGAIQNAWHYAKDLNESLNNIRIITGYNTDQMAQFAEEANKAAKALSTTTTAYTNASLIYYQQGLDDEAVKQRTDVTIKLANVSRQSAEEVSSQMTAIWNNFDDGTKSLEYYADAITALGAKTASSSAEIAEGLQKFAAVSDTVGLSYEYATAALATVVAQTRQSADTVGTAFKTLFARIEGLKLGETLEDGTTFNQYSETLAKVGVNIKDANGELRNMDNILDDLGAKWQVLNRDEQVAVAQKVAGVRQYQQMIALMDNYDLFKQNVNIAAGSAGTLQKQQDIYAESWEAASKRVKASLETIYKTLLNDEGFIKMTNGIAKVIDKIGDFIKAIGGAKGVLLGLSGILTRVFSKDIAAGIQSLTFGLKGAFGQNRKEAMSLQSKATQYAKDSSLDTDTHEGDITSQVYGQRAAMQEEYNNKVERLTELQRLEAQHLMDQVHALEEKAILEAQSADKAEQAMLVAVKNFEVINQRKSGANAGQAYIPQETITALQTVSKDVGALDTQFNTLRSTVENFGGKTKVSATELTTLLDNLEEKTTSIQTTVGNEGLFPGRARTAAVETFTEIESRIQQIKTELQTLQEQGIINEDGTFDTASVEVKQLLTELKELLVTQEEIEQGFQNIKSSTVGINLGGAATSVKAGLDEIAGSARKAGADAEAASNSLRGTRVQLEGFQQTIQKTQRGPQTMAKTIGAVSQSIMTLGMIITTVQGVITTFNNPDSTGWEKFQSVLMGLIGLTPMVLMSISSVKAAMVEAGMTSQAAWGWIGLVIGAVTAVVTATVILIKSRVSETEKEIQSLQNSIKELEKESENLQSEIDGINQGLSQYESAIETLNDCTRGTKEWNKALQDVESSIVSLLSAYPDLAKIKDLFKWDSDTGTRILNTEAIQEYVNNKQSSLSTIQSAKLRTDAQLAQKRASQELTDTINDLAKELKVSKESVSNNIDNFSSALSGKELADKILKQFPTLDETEVTTVANNYVKTLHDLANNTNEAAIQVDNAATLIANANLKLTPEDEEKGYSSALYTIGGRMEQNYTENYKNQYLDQILGFDQYKQSQNIFTQGGIESNITDALHGNIFPILVRGMQEIEGAIIDDALVGLEEGNKAAIDEIWSLYGQATGKEYKPNYRNAVQGKGDKRRLSYINEEGKTETVSAQTIAATIAEYLAEKQTQEDGLETARKILDQLQLDSKDSKNDFIDYLASGEKDLSNMSQKQVNEYATRQGKEQDILTEIFGSPENLEEYALSVGSTVEEVVQNFAKAVESGKKNLDDVAKDLSTVVQEQFSSIPDSVKDSLSFNEQKSVTDLMEKAYQTNGKEASQYVATLFSDLGENADEVIKMLENEDFDLSSESLNQYNKAIEDSGLSGVITADKLLKLAEAIKQVGSASDLSTLQSQYAEKKKITDGLETGSSISAEDWATLDLDPKIANQYFQEMLDGTHVLTGKAEEFQEAVNEIELQPFKDLLNDINGELLKYNGFESSETYNSLLGQADIKQATTGGEWQAQDIANQQLDYLEGAGYSAEDFNLGELRDEVSSGTANEDTYLKIADALEKCGDQSQKFNAKLQENVSTATKLKEMLETQQEKDFIEGEGLDFQEYQNLAKHIQSVAKESDKLADTLQKDEQAAKRVAESVLRFDKALVKIDKNYEGWMKTMKSGSLQDQAKVINEVKEAYADMLDVDIDSVSDGFATNAKNLELMKKAAAGSETAYKELQTALRQDIAAKIGIDDADFQAGFNDLMAKYYEGQSLDDLEVGASLNDEGFLQGLTDMVNKAGMTAEQATDYLSSMGVDATVETVKEEAPPAKHEYTGAKANVTTQTVNSVDPLTAEPVTYEIPSIHYEEDKFETTDTQESTATALKVTAANKSSGGKFKFDNSNHGGGTGGGKKSCFIAGTKVSLGQSFKNIEDIKIGDIVFSYNEQTHKNEYSKVLQTMIHYVNEKIYDLYIEDEVLSVTGVHRFYIKQNDFIRWVAAENLEIGDNVLFADGTWHKINNIKVSVQLTIVYNFEVANNHNYYVGKNQILAHNKGGGGGGSSKPAKKERAPKRTDTVDRYKEINDKLKIVNRNLDKYNALTDAAYGKNKLKGMQQIIEAYNDQIRLQQKLIKEAENYAKIDKQNLEDAAKELKVTLKYDEDGNVSNIESVQNIMADKIEALYAKYNSFSTAEQQSTFKDETMEPYTEQVNHFKDMLSQYESTLDTIAEAKQEKLNLSIEQMNKRLESRKYKIQLRFDVREREINNFTRELTKLEKVAFTTGRQLALMNAQVRATRDESKAMTSGIRNILADGVYQEIDGKAQSLRKIYKNDKDGLKSILDALMKHGGTEAFWEKWKITPEAMESLVEYADKCLELSDNLDEVIEKMTNMIPNIYDRILEKTDKLVSKMDTLINRYTTWMEIIELLGKEWLFKNDDGSYNDSFMQVLRTNSNQNAIDKVKGAKANENLAVTAWAAGVKNQPTQEKVIDAQIDKLKDERTNALRDTELYASKKRWNKQHPGKEMTGYQYRDWLEDTYLPAREKERKDWADRIKELENKGKKRTSAETKELSQLYDKTEKSLGKSKKASEWIAEWDQVLDTYDSKIQQEEQKKVDIANNVQDLENQMEEAKNVTVETLMEALQTIIENTVLTLQDVRKQYEDFMAEGYHSIQDMQDAMARNKKISEQYLGDYEKVYELTKLNRDLEKKMDETTNLKAKQKLAEYQKKILDYAREGVKMSKYDLEYMQKEYDLEVAKIALEEAQNAKTQVRLTRDAEGNYSYTYTADESKTAEAQQTYEDRLNEIVKLSNDYQEQMLESELALKQERLDSLAELDEALARHQITEQEYGEKVAALEKYYTEQSVYFARERDNAARNNTYVLMNELAPYYDITEKKIGVSNKFNETEVKNFNAAKERLEQARRDREASLTEIENQLAAGKISAEKYEAKLAEINSKYTEETTAAETMIKTTMTSIEQNMGGVTTYAEGKFLPEYSSTWKSASESNQEFEEKFELWRTDVKGVLDGSEQDLKDTVKAAGIPLDESKDMWEQVGLYIASQNSSIRGEINNTETDLETAVTKGKSELTEASNDLDTWWKKTYPILAAAQTELQTVADKILGIQTAAAGLDTITVNTDTAEAEKNLNSIIKKLNAIKKKQKALKTNGGHEGDDDDAGGDDDTGGGKGGTGGGKGGTQGDKKLQVGDIVTLKAGQVYANDSWGNGKVSEKSRDKYAGAGDTKVKIIGGSSKYVDGGRYTTTGDYYILIASKDGKTNLGWVKKSQISGYDTGGYTGKWGIDGRLAMLHQKELVLNAEDTENMLAAVKTVREIAAIVDLQAQNASLAGQYALAIGQLTGTHNAQSLDQNVHITAEFPNVQDHNEIEMALTSLVNRASQYAWRN